MPSCRWRFAVRIFGLFFFNDTATTEIYTLSLHDALPILPSWLTPITAPTSPRSTVISWFAAGSRVANQEITVDLGLDRKSTRLNSSHANISYAVFCLKKKKM